MDVTSFGNRVIADVNSKTDVILERGGPLIQYGWRPYKKQRDRDVRGECPVTRRHRLKR